mmetsp:Transcript_67801/g.196064  ORF Transcript_67801/g.196064 Transcript_67801/m.196064 type:complete len:257 (-) Transcript_67801:148-918(-)
MQCLLLARRAPRHVVRVRRPGHPQLWGEPLGAEEAAAELAALEQPHVDDVQRLPLCRGGSADELAGLLAAHRHLFAGATPPTGASAPRRRRADSRRPRRGPHRPLPGRGAVLAAAALGAHDPELGEAHRLRGRVRVHIPEGQGLVQGDHLVAELRVPDHHRATDEDLGLRGARLHDQRHQGLKGGLQVPGDRARADLQLAEHRLLEQGLRLQPGEQAARRDDLLRAQALVRDQRLARQRGRRVPIHLQVLQLAAQV